VFCGQQMLAAKLRRSNIEASAESVRAFARLRHRTQFSCFGVHYDKYTIAGLCTAHLANGLTPIVLHLGDHDHIVWT
jgi:hypothetical protein